MSVSELDRVTEAAVQAAQALVGLSVRSLGEALEQVTLAQYRVVMLVTTRGPLRSGVIAEEIGVHASTFTRMADRLVAGGWVERVDNDENRREVLISPTPAGRALVEQVTARRRAEFRRILRRVDAAQRQVVLAGLSAFAAAADDPDPAELLRLGVES